MADPSSTPFRAEIEAYYALGLESSRLSEGYFPLEEARTRELILRHLPDRPLRILDVGGASGRYALWLAERGHEVHLLDPVALHVEQARQASAAAAQPLASAGQGDARRLAWSDASVDAVLMLGPLYHLCERPDRLAALREALRVLKPEGFLFAAAISRFASLVEWLTGSRRLADEEFRQIAFADAHRGLHRNETGRPELFTTAYFHRPEELREEVEESGLAVLDLLAIEGPGAQVRDFVDVWGDASLRARILEAVRLVEREPMLLGMSPHLLVIGQHPGQGGRDR